jgi:hypothetical protein
VEEPEEILADLGLAGGPEPPEPGAVAALEPTARRVLDAVPLDREILTDEIVAALDLPAGAVLAALGRLALEGLVTEEAGGAWGRA